MSPNLSPRSGDTTCQDPLTGRTVHRLTQGGLNVSPYFNNHAWTPEGDVVFYLRHEGGHEWVRACEVETGRSWPLAGPFAASGEHWTTLNAIPGHRAVSFVAEGAVWRAELEGPAERVAQLPPGDCDIGDTDVSGDGRWHTVGCVWMSEAARREAPEVWWPPDDYYAKHQLRTLLLRVDLNTGGVEELWEEPAVVDHISINPHEPDLIVYCHEGAIPYQYGRMFLRRVGEASGRPVRDQRSGRVKVTHERWFADGERIAYHGQWLPEKPEAGAVVHYVGVFDVARDLPQEYPLSEPGMAAWHSSPSPDGSRMVMDQQGGEPGLYLLELDRGKGVWKVEQLTSVHSDDSEVPHGQWHETDPVWSPDGKRVLFRAVQGGECDLYVVEAG